MKEVWKTIKEAPDYKISNLGRLKSKTRTIKERRTNKTYTIQSRILKPRYNPKGYIQYCLRINKKYVYKYAHRLVAQAFLKNPKNLNQVNHIDCNKQNNDVKNLEWCTHFENSQHATTHMRFKHGEKHHKTFLTKKQVLEIKRLLKTDVLQKDLAKKFNCSKQTINDIKMEKTWKWLKGE